MAHPRTPPRRGSAPVPAPVDGPPSGLTINISLREIYASLCPACREALLALIATKAQTDSLRDALRSQLESPPPSP